MKLTETEQQLFAILFASGEPAEKTKLCEALIINFNTLESAIEALRSNIEKMQLPLELRTLGDAIQLCTAHSHKEVIKRALDIKRNTPLSPAAMEVLAIIAYNQPVSRGFVEQVRGVDSSSVVVSLVDKGLVEEAGRMELPGRPIAYKTTHTFLRCFGLMSLEELPQIGLEDANYSEESQLSLDV